MSAEGIVEGLPGVAESTIETHEEAAEAALCSAILLGALALTALALPARMAGAKPAATLGSLVFAVVAFGLVGRAANLGGLIRRTEISGRAAGPGGDDVQLGVAQGEEDEGEIEH